MADTLAQGMGTKHLPFVLQVLRLGVYELTQSGLAAHALNEHVNVVKAMSHKGAANFANAVLRSAARHIEAGTLPTPEVSPGVDP